MAKITVDGKEYEVDGSKNLLAAVLSLGFDLPYFCWHPCLDSVGACRQCAVKKYRDENDETGTITMACMTPAADGSRIAINDAEALNFRSSIIEWLMINHPHDCPVCPEGGECHLQDMTLMTGHTKRRYRGTKRTHRNQDLGPFLQHEMNRCIACYRCTRFYRDYAGGDDLNVFSAHNNVYFGRESDGTLENEFSGNLAEVCPTGVFTDKTLGPIYNRKWDMENAPGICTHCSLGCNTSPGARTGLLKRIQNRYHGEINGYFLCDRGRFGAGHVNRDDRPRQPLVKSQTTLEPVEADAALQQARQHISNATGVIGIGSPRATVEGNYALRHLVGADNFSTGMSASRQTLTQLALHILRDTPARTPAMRQTEACDAVLILGEDVTQNAPRLALSLRQSVRNAAFANARDNNIPAWHDRAVRDMAGDMKSPLFIATPAATRLDDIAADTLHARPAAIAALGHAVAHALDASAPAATDIDEPTQQLANTIAEALKAADNPLIVAGTSLGSQAVLQAAANVARALGEHGNIFLPLEECNSAGVALLGGMDVDTVLQKVTSGEADTLVVLENDLYRRASKATVDAALDAATNLIVIDHSTQATSARADIVLPAGSFAEADGTLVNNEGRAQRFFQVFVPDNAILAGWRWCSALHGEQPAWQVLDELITAVGEDCPQLAGIRDAAPNAAFREAGMRIPRLPHRYSGRTAQHAHENVHEPAPQQDPDSALAFSMEGWSGQRPAALRPFAWAPGWDSNQQAIAKYQDEVAGSLTGGDPGAQLLGASPSGADYFAVQQGDDADWLAVPLHHIFGSELTSTLAPAVAERAPQPYFAVNAADAGRLGVAEGDQLTLTLSGEQRVAPVKLVESLADGSIGVPAGLDGLAGIALPQQVQP